MGDASSAILVGACAGVAVVSLALGYLAELVIPVQIQKQLLPALPALPALPKEEKNIEERVKILEKATLPTTVPAVAAAAAAAPPETPNLRVVG
jgi:hypothetical protein